VAWSVLDLSSITDHLVKRLQDEVNSWPFVPAITPVSVVVSGSMPETVRNEGPCQLSLYLLHICQDKFQRNVPAQTNKRHPLSLELYYLLSAYDQKNFNVEQQVMSLALRFFHENSILKDPINGAEYVISMEMETVDSTARLWQALSTPLRMSVLYKVSVVFVTPSQTPLPSGAPPQRVGLSVSPATIPVPLGAQLFGTSSTINYSLPPGSAPGDGDAVLGTFSPAAVGAEEALLLSGSNLDLPAYQSVYLRDLHGLEIDITAWRSVSNSANQVRLSVPGAGVSPGVYLIAVGSDTPAVLRSNSTPISIMSRITSNDLGQTLLPDAGGLYTITGTGFVAAQTEVLLGATPLVQVATAPAAGQYQITAAETQLRLRPHSPLPEPGRYQVRVLVNQIEAFPTRYINL
jgi:Pvc16 N-terminal domain